ncbi:MAG: hypothetical protein B6242_07305 [Anaerolineaceae bacterium 4572_78]|nr:MAG: hypothetical protein B6242_07305 [Anaerolineaceae bacterium 4572_78]
MINQALYRKWRSQSFNDIIGQDHITQTLQNALEMDRIGHAYLFNGPRGTGKTSTARILAKAVNCTGTGKRPCNTCAICRSITEGRQMDLIEIDAASNTSVDDIRDLRDKVGFRPGEVKRKFYIIDETHMLSKSAFNALLKTLEEPPPHVIFVLATTEPEKIPETILSRCQRFDFRRISVEKVAERLAYIMEHEGLKAEKDALLYIARQGSGSMRDSISLLDQLTAYGHDIITLDLVQSVLGTVNQATIQKLVGYLFKRDITVGLALINKVVADGVEPRRFTLAVLEYLRDLLLIMHGQDEVMLGLSVEMAESMRQQTDEISAIDLFHMTKRFSQAVRDFKFGAGETIIPQLPLELAFVDVAINEAQPQVQIQTPVVAAAKPSLTKQSPQRIADTSPIKSQSHQSKHVSKTSSVKLPPPVNDLTVEILRKRWKYILAELRTEGVNFESFFISSAIKSVDIHGHTIYITWRVLGKKWSLEFQSPAMNTPANSIPEPQLSQASSNDTPSVGDDELVKEAMKLGGKFVGREPI